MKRYPIFILICSLLVLMTIGMSCSNNPSETPPTPDTPSMPEVIYGREYWGEWKRLDQSETWLINSTSITVNGKSLDGDFSLSKPSENVISTTINGITDCLYAVRTASSSISGTVTSREVSRALSAGYASVIVKNINDANDIVETSTDANGDFTAENLIVGEEYNVTIGDTSLTVKPSFDGEDIGTITLMSGVNFKVTLSNTNSVMYAGSEYYSMDLIIENIGDTNCTAATYSLIGDDGLDVINNYSDGVLLRTVAAGETKKIPLRVKCSELDTETTIKKLNLEISDRNGTTWNDSVSLKFYRDSVTINVVSETGRPISGVIIGDGRTYSITNRTNYSISIPVTAESYLMVFSGAIANATKNTEAAYSIGVNCPAVSATNLLTELGTGTNSYEPNDDEDHAKAVIFGKSIVSYLYENDIDYYFLEPLHLWDAGVVIKEATCMEDGSIAYTCTVCGETYAGVIPATGHAFSQEWEKDDNYHWHLATCGHDVVSEKLEHNWVAGAILSEPSKTAEGMRLYECTACGQTKTESIPMIPYEIGEVGPAGGYIIYDCDADNERGNADGLISSVCGWRYLEAASTDVRIVNGVPTIDSSMDGYSESPALYQFGCFRREADGPNLFVNGTTEYDEASCTKGTIGSGERNTYLLVSVIGDEAYKEQSGSEKISAYAAKLCYDLVHIVDGVSYDDWFLPSRDELDLIYKNLRVPGIGTFVNYKYWFEYWSSSEYDYTTEHAWYQSYDDGRQYGGDKGHDLDQVRPVRAFLQNEQDGHKYEQTILKEPSCTEGGITRYTCSGCGHTFEVSLPALGHSFSDDWLYDSDFHWHASTCGHDTISGKNAHLWDDGEIKKEPTHSEEGLISYVCLICGKNKAEILSRTGYEIGEVGPAGGYIFYDCDADNDAGNADGLISTECGWRYLEAAPGDLWPHTGQPATDSMIEAFGFDISNSGIERWIFGLYLNDKNQFSYVNRTPNFDSTNCTNTAIGSGSQNTNMLVSIMGNEAYSRSDLSEKTTNYGAKACANLNYNGFDDWFLPSRDELNLMYTNLKLQGIGDFSSSEIRAIYLSSSESDDWSLNAWGQNFVDGAQYRITRGQSSNSQNDYRDSRIRPIRAFSLIEPQGHQVITTVTRPSTCIETGILTYTCTSCGFSYDEIIPISDHNFVGKECTVCHEKLYSVGDTGPGGGKVFYDKGFYDDGWRYIEAWGAVFIRDGVITGELTPGYSSYQNVFHYPGSIYTSSSFINGSITYNPDTCTRTGIGEGKRNTELIVSKIGDGDNPAAIASKFEWNGFDDWYLPSSEELDLIGSVLKWSNAWSSSEAYYYDSGYGNAGVLWWASESASYQNKISISLSATNSTWDHAVVAIRYF